MKKNIFKQAQSIIVQITGFPNGLDDYESHIVFEQYSIMSYDDEYIYLYTSEDISSFQTLMIGVCFIENGEPVLDHIYINKSHIITVEDMDNNNHYYIKAKIPSIEQEIHGKTYIYKARAIERLKKATGEIS